MEKVVVLVWIMACNTKKTQKNNKKPHKTKCEKVHFYIHYRENITF